MDAVRPYLPAAKGYLPLWMLFVSGLAVFNTVQNYTTTKLTRRVYSRSPGSVTSLQSRTFGLWTITAAAVRFYAAYNLHDRSHVFFALSVLLPYTHTRIRWYNLALITYVIVNLHYWSEFFVYRTIKLDVPALSPLIVGGVSLYWMIAQYGFYVKN